MRRGVAAITSIHGASGIGKTVLATMLARDREVRCAFPDGAVWLSLGHHQTDITGLQRFVLQLFGSDTYVQNEVEGKKELKKALARKAMLLILDDARDVAQVKAFDVRRRGCRLVVTTRDASLLARLRSTEHQVQLPSEKEALQLLAQCAERPVKDLPAMARKIVRWCGRLPLALSICGAMTCDGASRDGIAWSDLLDALKEDDPESSGHPRDQVIKAIKVSIGRLAPGEAQRFGELSVFRPGANVPEIAVHTLWARTARMAPRNARDLLDALERRCLLRLDTEPAQSEEPASRRVSLHSLAYDYTVRITGRREALHQKLLDAYRAKCSDGWHSGPNDGYFFENLCRHFVLAERTDDLAALLEDVAFLEAKVVAGLTFDLPGDFAEALRAVPAEHPERKILALIDEAIRRDIHFIARHARDYPQALFQCLWNSCWWYDCSEAKPHYVHPEEGSQTSAPWKDTGRKLHEHMEHARASREHSHPAFPWIRNLRPPELHLDSAKQLVLQGHTGNIAGVAFSADGTGIVTASWDNDLRTWDARSGVCLHTLQGHSSWLVCVAFSPDGTRIASGALDETLRIWDADSGTCIHTLHHPRMVYGVAYSPDGTCVVSHSDDKTLRMWNAQTGVLLNTLKGHASLISTEAFSPDGTLIVTGSNDKTLRIWDATSGACLNTLRGHTGSIECVAFSADSRRIVSGAKDKTIRIWDATSGACIRVLKGHVAGVDIVALSPDGTRVTSCSSYKVLRMWDADSGACLEEIEARGDVAAIAAAPKVRRFRALARDPETVIEDTVSGSPVAWFPGALYHVTTHPTESVWTASVRNGIYLCIVRLERGGAPPADGRRRPSRRTNRNE
jgi:WD40 repeat protein